jgi:hypothetical protein
VSKTTVVSILFLLAVLGVLVYSTLDLQGYSCEVCITFNGRTNCAKASGTTREEAQRTATDTACAPITGGMSETIGCSNTTPDSVNWY